MSNSRLSLSLVLTCVAVPVLAILLGVGAALAQSSSTHYTFMVATGFLCDSADSSACPAVVKSANGDSFEISGVGTLTTPEKSVSAAGTFTCPTASLPAPRGSPSRQPGSSSAICRPFQRKDAKTPGRKGRARQSPARRRLPTYAF